MSPEEFSDKLISAVAVKREDITRAKQYSFIAEETDVNALADMWIKSNDYSIPTEVDIDSQVVEDYLNFIARAYSLRLALYQAIAELIAAGELIPADSIEIWQPHITWRTPRGGGGINIKKIKCPFPRRIYRPPLSAPPSSDIDIFLQGIDCSSLHIGIQEAINQALNCFRRGLYLPSIVMLASAVEATWLECGLAIAAKLANVKLQGILNDPYKSLSLKVTETRKALDNPNGKALLKIAGQSSSKIVDAELWTTTIRDRRNALHWGKARSFVADHSDTASLLIAAPIHIGTLEAIRLAC